MFGIFPDWVGDTLTLVAMVFGTPGLILFFLGRKDANRKLQVDEGGLTVEQFNAALPAYKDLLDRASSGKKEAEDKLKEYDKRFEEVEKRQEELVSIFVRILRKNNITLTESELGELEHTQPNFKRRFGY